MGVFGKVLSLATGKGRRGEPAGTVHVVDPSPLNWLYITYNTVEELIRVRPDGIADLGRDEELPLGGRPHFGDRHPRGQSLPRRRAPHRRRRQAVLRRGVPLGVPRTRRAPTSTSTPAPAARSRRAPGPAPPARARRPGPRQAPGVPRHERRVLGGPGFGYVRNGSGEGHW